MTEAQKSLVNVQASLETSELDKRITMLEHLIEKERLGAFSEFCKTYDVANLDIFERDNLEEAQKFITKKHTMNTLLLKITEQY